MVMRMIFTEFLLAFCAVHIASEIQSYLSRKFAAYRGLAGRKAESAKSRNCAIRGDWYVYFQRSQLTGERCGEDRSTPPDMRNGRRAPSRTRSAVQPAFAGTDGRVPVRPRLRLVLS